MSVAAADVYRAVVALWNSSNISNQFTAHWSVSNTAEFPVLNEKEAEGAHPFPYAVFELMAPSVKTRMTGSTAITNQELRDVSCRFKVLARDAAGSSAKIIAATLAEEIMKVFGGHPTVQGQFNDYAMTHGHILNSQYQTDFAVREDIGVYAWVVQYILKTDVPVRI